MLKNENLHMQDPHNNFNEIFETLCRAHYETLVMYARKFMENTDDARDLTQELFVKLWDQKGQFESIEHGKNYCFATIRNMAINKLAKKKTTNASKKLFREYLLTQQASEEIATNEFEAEWVKKIYAEIKKLPERQQKILELQYEKGLAPKDVARKLNIQKRTVWNAGATAIRKIRKMLSEKKLPILLFCISISL